jgi:arylmalonate decarboxylase
VEFPAIIDGAVLVQQNIPNLPNFDYTLSNIHRAHPEICAAARLLGEAGCSAVAMEGTPFGWAGLATEADARERAAEMSEAAGVPGVMAGTSIVDALRALGVNRVALCPTYYPNDWRDAWRRFIALCDFEITYCATMADQGLVDVINDTDDHGWSTGRELISAAVEIAAAAGPSDAIVVTGAGSRTSPIITELERIAGRPVVGSDTALFWSLARAAGLALVPNALGALSTV